MIQVPAVIEVYDGSGSCLASVGFVGQMFGGRLHQPHPLHLSAERKGRISAIVVRAPDICEYPIPLLMGSHAYEGLLLTAGDSLTLDFPNGQVLSSTPLIAAPAFLRDEEV